MGKDIAFLRGVLDRDVSSSFYSTIEKETFHSKSPISL